MPRIAQHSQPAVPTVDGLLAVDGTRAISRVRLSGYEKSRGYVLESCAWRGSLPHINEFSAAHASSYARARDHAQWPALRMLCLRAVLRGALCRPWMRPHGLAMTGLLCTVPEG